VLTGLTSEQMTVMEEVIIPQSRNELLEVIRGQNLPFVLPILYTKQHHNVHNLIDQKWIAYHNYVGDIPVWLENCTEFTASTS